MLLWLAEYPWGRQLGCPHLLLIFWCICLSSEAAGEFLSSTAPKRFSNWCFNAASDDGLWLDSRTSGLCQSLILQQLPMLFFSSICLTCHMYTFVYSQSYSSKFSYWPFSVLCLILLDQSSPKQSSVKDSWGFLLAVWCVHILPVLGCEVFWEGGGVDSPCVVWEGGGCWFPLCCEDLLHLATCCSEMFHTYAIYMPYVMPFMYIGNRVSV